MSKPYQHHDPIEDQGKAVPQPRVHNNHFKQRAGRRRYRWYLNKILNIFPPTKQPSLEDRRRALIAAR